MNLFLSLSFHLSLMMNSMESCGVVMIECSFVDFPCLVMSYTKWLPN